MITEHPRIGPPVVGDSLGARPTTEQKPVANPLMARVNNYLAAMNAGGDDASANYQAALADLRKNPDEAIVVLSQAEARAERDAYPLRWALVYAATQMNHDAALPFLRNLVLSPIPPEQSSAPHSYSTVGQETVLRTTAVEGIGRLAARGNERALQSLFDFLSVASISVCRASVQAILATNKRLRKKVAESLRAEHHFLLDVVAKEVTDVPQIQNPKRHLRDKKPRTKPTPPTISQGDRKAGAENPGPKLGE